MKTRGKLVLLAEIPCGCTVESDWVQEKTEDWVTSLAKKYFNGWIESAVYYHRCELVSQTNHNGHRQ
jgi:hypothetical protein